MEKEEEKVVVRKRRASVVYARAWTSLQPKRARDSNLVCDPSGLQVRKERDLLPDMSVDDGSPLSLAAASIMTPVIPPPADKERR